MLFVKIIICLHTFRQGSREEILEPAAHFNNNVSKLSKFKLTVFQTKCLLVSHEDKSCTGRKSDRSICNQYHKIDSHLSDIILAHFC